jgi:hypothetical protein
MEQTLQELLRQSPTVAVLLIVLRQLFSLYTSERANYQLIVSELKAVIRENTIAMNELKNSKRKCEYEIHNNSHELE